MGKKRDYVIDVGDDLPNGNLISKQVAENLAKNMENVKKYRLLKDLPGFEKGAMFYVNVNDRLLPLEPGPMDMAFNFTQKMFEMRSDMKDWFEPVEDRIRLHWSGGLVGGDELYIKSDRKITSNMLRIMERALNGELFTKEDMIDIIGTARQYQRCLPHTEIFDDWLKYRES